MKKQIVVFSLVVIAAAMTAVYAGEPNFEQEAKKSSVKVVSVDAANNTIDAKDQAGTSFLLKVSPQAALMKEGKSITLADIKSDDTLAIEYIEEGGGMTLKSATVISSAAKSARKDE
jgi:hypothetical protein